MYRQWEKLETWLEANRPAVLADLNAGADEAAVDDLQARLGLRLPEDFIACLRVHNGQKGQAAPLFDTYAFLPARRILMSWTSWNELQGGGETACCSVERVFLCMNEPAHMQIDLCEIRRDGGDIEGLPCGGAVPHLGQQRGNMALAALGR